MHADGALCSYIMQGEVFLMNQTKIFSFFLACMVLMSFVFLPHRLTHKSLKKHHHDALLGTPVPSVTLTSQQSLTHHHSCHTPPGNQRDTMCHPPHRTPGS
ncbi:hypothetical protein ILYODFUR_037413 [Ilyodon furcidens]|uniref:Uncharacterized protein n=1 Tax=Ilyodon furcidens TaxID=33524 RepID=A0ABV0VLV2_9TELE